LDYTVQKLRSTQQKHGPDAVGVLSSAKCTNEENYLLQKLTRAGLQTNNIDHCARL
jgi:predicted molibdopterin-dependent oxidoreductase YjgC